mmetsp:Transcript_26532/g.43320  ORF Transcript_26532/g.43320 Transcript_26532/m.43320 type:complete len:80 (-) Transcript_26532:148-387(-)
MQRLRKKERKKTPPYVLQAAHYQANYSESTQKMSRNVSDVLLKLPNERRVTAVEGYFFLQERLGILTKIRLFIENIQLL